MGRPPSRPVDTPGHGLAAPPALEAVAAFAVHHRPWRLVDRHILDLPRRQACAAGQEGHRVRAADLQQHGRLDLGRPRGAADIASVPDLGAAESGRRETAVAKMPGSRINGAMFMAGGAVDRRLESEGGYLAERREGQRVERPARLERAGVQWRINFLPAVLMPAVLAPLPLWLAPTSLRRRRTGIPLAIITRLRLLWRVDAEQHPRSLTLLRKPQLRRNSVTRSTEASGSGFLLGQSRVMRSAPARSGTLSATAG